MELIGSIVISKAGRDKRKVFVIVGTPDPEHVLVADGDLRRIEKPKLKKLKHIQLTQYKIPVIKTKIEQNAVITNAEIRKSLLENCGNCLIAKR
ncbi:MAG: KOW domain-containing RNA-binding protein [Clostridia bacterium]|nr:KOW domain-containing RNA-binding protein [Clostridia bacterium]